jgi:hypothetical protein
MKSLTSSFEVLSRSFTGRVEVNHEIFQAGPTNEWELSRIRSTGVSKIIVAFVPENLREVSEYELYRYKTALLTYERRTLFISCLSMFSVIC